jgi:hypothetical protein
VPFEIPALPSPTSYFLADIQNQVFLNALPGVNPTFMDFYGPVVAGFDIFQGLREAQRILAQHYNLVEVDRQQLYDIASFTEYIANNLPAGGGVDLSTVEFWLQGLKNDTGNIAMTLGGGAPLGFGDIVTALDQGFFEVANQIFGSSQLSHFDISQLINALSEVGAGSGVELLKNDIARIPVLLAQLNQILAVAAGSGDPATQHIADNTKEAAIDDALLRLMSDTLSQVDWDEYQDHVTTSGPLALISVAARAWPAIRAALSAGKAVGNTALAGVALDQLFNEGKVTGQVVDPVMHWFTRALEKVTPLVGKIAKTGLTVADQFTEPLEKFFQPVFQKMLDGVKESVAGVGEIGPAGGFKAAETFLSKAAINGMHAHHLAELIEMMPHFKHFGMHMLPAFMSDMAGFGQIASQTWGRAVGEGVGRAAGYEINASMRSRIPDPRTLEQMVFEGQLSEADQAVLLSFYGFNNDYIERMQTIQYIEPNLRQLSGLAADATMPEAQTETWLREIGFSPKDAAALLPIVMQQSMKAERGSLQTEVMANLRAGLLTEADADLYFDQLRLHPLARNMLFTSARLGLRRNSIEDNITTYKQIYGDGLMDDNDFRLALQSQGATDARVTVELAQVANKRFGKVADEEAAETKAEMRKQQGLLISALREAFQHGMIDASNFEQTLEHGGISRPVASATVELERIKLEGRALTSRSAEAARLLQQEIRLREDTFVELFRKGLINNLQLQQFLSGLGLPHAVVDALVERELARARPSTKDLFVTPGALKAKELFTLAKAKLQVQFSKGAIDADAYLTQLVALGMDADIARATVALDVARRSGEKQPPAPAKTTDKSLSDLKRQVDEALAKFAQTSQTPAALEDILSRLGIVEEVVDALVALANEQAAALAAQENAA